MFTVATSSGLVGQVFSSWLLVLCVWCGRVVRFFFGFSHHKWFCVFGKWVLRFCGVAVLREIFGFVYVVGGL